jgi:D-alanyl-D-alanine carboxypeptidase
VGTHTGNIVGYTQFAAASSNGRRSVTMSVTEQLDTGVGAPGVIDALRRMEALGVCDALTDG